MIVTKEFTFDCAHMLDGHEGLCKNLHGHTYKLSVGVEAKNPATSDGAKMNMVVDFSKLKKIVQDNVLSFFDHAFIFNMQSKDECEQQLKKLLDTHGKKVMTFPTRTTAEEMSKFIFQMLMPHIGSINCSVVFVQLWETPTSSAICRREDVE